MSNVTYSREVLADLATRASAPDEVLLLLGLEPTHQRPWQAGEQQEGAR
ncbi:hypothetical protein [Streptacidiphilus sp. PAMC 29251]